MAIAKKQLGALEDLVFSADAPLTFQQTRSGVLLNLTKICAATLPYSGTYGQVGFKSMKDKIDEAIYLGLGDMLKSVYDTNNNGKVDNAEIAVGVNLDISNVTPPTIGQIRWNQDEKTADLGINGVTLQLGQELMTMVRNSTSTTITQGTTCMGTGTMGASGRITVAPADMSNTVNAFRTLGVATEDIAPGTDGFVTYFGKVRTLNTSIWNEGDILYLSNTSPGVLTNVVPTTGVKQTIARVINKHAVNGTLMVRTLPFNELAYEPKNVNIQAHVASTSNPHGVTAAQVGTYSIATQDWRGSMMSKAQFNALASERRVNRAGSGFDSLGAQYFADNLQGIRLLPTNVNSFFMGSDIAGSIGNIKECINGVIHKHYDGTSGYEDQIITLPPAPTVLPYDATLTVEQIASGVIKHADASNSGLIVNGKFDMDTSGWSNFDASLSIDANRLKITSNAGSTSGTFGIHTLSNLVVGKKYIVEFNVISISSGSLLFRVGAGTATQPFNYIHSVTPTIGRNSIEFTATLTNHHIFMGLVTSAGQNAIYDNIAVFPADAISRSDLVFLESWHEDVSEKDFVYPLGNVQYLGTTGDCGATVAGAFAGSATYSLFSDTWQADGALVGKGYVWSTLSDANKKAFVSNPENNCYLDGDKVIQVRYRMRVVQGFGDSWVNVSSMSINGTSGYTLRYGSFGAFNLDGTVKPKGKKVAIINKDIDIYQNGMYADLGNVDSSYNKSGLVYIGAFGACNSAWSVDIAYGYEGKCFALPIALIYRRNQGGYNATYNSNGTKAMTMTPTSIADCFNIANLTTATGYIGTSTPRPDGLFYDQISVEDFKPSNKGADLRNSSKKRTAQSLIEEFAPKALASTIPYYNNDTTPLTTYKDFMEVRDTSGNRYPIISKVGNVATIGATVANKKGFSIVTKNGKQYLQVADDVASDATVQMNLSTVKYDIGVFDA